MPTRPFAFQSLEPRLLLAVSFDRGAASPFASAGGQLVVGRFNADAYPDVVVSDTVPHPGGDATGVIRVFTNDHGNRTFDLAATIPIEEPPPELIVADFNNDLHDDVLGMPLFANSLRFPLLLGNGDGTFQAPRYVTFSTSFSTPTINDIAAADFNKDGKMDFVATARSSPTVVFFGDGNGQFTNRTILPPAGLDYVAAGDVNNDGKADIVAHVYGTQTINVFLGFGNANFALPLTETAQGDVRDLALGELTGDLLPEILVASAPLGLKQGAEVFPNLGNGTFNDSARFNPGVPASWVGVADFNGDYSTDLLVGSDVSGVVHVYTNAGTTLTFNRVTLPGFVDQELGIADFTFDGKPDVIGFTTGGNLELLTNTATYNGLIRGTLWDDINGDGAIAQTESRLPGRYVYVDANNSGNYEDGETFAVTDANGAYTFNLPPGTYRLRQLIPGGWYATTPGTAAAPLAHNVTVSQLVTTPGWNFGSARPATISGRVYYDYAQDGISDDSDPGLGGFQLFVDYNYNGAREPSEPTTFTDFNGHYAIAGLVAGNYQVRLVKPAGWQQTTPSRGAILNNGPFYTLAPGGFATNYTDFGVIEPSFVTGRVFDDKNADGVQQLPDEPGLPGRYAYVDLDRDGAAEPGEPYGLTNSAGDYYLTVPYAGTFHVGVGKVSGWSPRVPASGVYTNVPFPVGQTVVKKFGLTQGALNNAGFKTPVNLPSGLGSNSNPYAVAVGDFNKDNNPDFAVSNNSSDVTVYTGDGLGGFTAASGGFAGASLRAIVAADVDGNGNMDLVVANHDTDDVSVLFGNGNGTFQPHVDYPVGDATTFVGPMALAVGFFNADNKPDLAVVGNGSTQLAVLLNNGSGGFGASTLIPTDFDGSAVAAGDLNNDGKVDLVTAHAAANKVIVLTGNGLGGFTVLGAVTDSIVGPAALLVADLDKDNKSDLAVVNGTGDNVRVYRGVGSPGTVTLSPTGSFPINSEPHDAAVADFDLDGKLDIAVACRSDGTTDTSGGISLLRGKGDGTFFDTLTSTAHTSPTGVGVGDFDKDGLPDVAAPNFFSDDVSVMINDRASAGAVAGFAFDDVNGNGGQDAGEAALGGQAFFLDLNDDGARDPATEPVATSDADGLFAFPSLAPGTYRVRPVASADWQPTAPGPGAPLVVVVGPGQNAAATFALHDVRAPAVFASQYVFAAPRMSVQLVFDEPVGASLAAGDIQLLNRTTGQTVPGARVAVVYDAGSGTATFSFPGYAGGALPDGDYRASIAGGAVTDASGNEVAAFALEFFVLAADVNHDRTVDFTDLVVLAQNYNGSDKTFVEGDYNYDAAVDFQDLVLLAQRYNTTLAPPPPAGAAAVFSTTPIARAAARARPAPRPVWG